MGDPMLLDLCCGAGGAAMGYRRAGFDVYGVDIDPQPNYPFWFHQGDALDVQASLLIGELVRFRNPAGEVAYRTLDDFVGAHASFPCQAENPLTTGTNKRPNKVKGVVHPQLIPHGRDLLLATGLPWVIENTAGAPIRKDLRLVGDMFRGPDGAYPLAVWRPRFLELHGFTVEQPPMPKKRGRTRGWRHGIYYDGPYFAVYGDGGGKGSVADWQAAMGIDWTDVKKELTEAIPPLYAEHVGRHLMLHVRGASVALDLTTEDVA